MYIYQGLVMLILFYFMMTFTDNSKYCSTVIFISFLFYFLFIISVESDTNYYLLVLLKDVITGLVLELKSKKVALFNYLLVLVNTLGFALWYFYVSSIYYDLSYGFIVIIQILFIIPKGLLSDGRNRVINKLSMGFSRCFVCIKAYAKMYKTH